VKDSGDLSSKVVSFLPKEEWIGVDQSVKVTREKDFDLSGSYDILWKEVWEFGPFVEEIVSDPVGKFIYA
jgi:hypothetical protein